MFSPIASIYNLRIIYKLNGELTQLSMVGSMPLTSNSSLQVSSLHNASSLAVVKGKAVLPQIHIMWSAFGLNSLPCGSRTTRIGLFLKCHLSPMDFLTTRSIFEGWLTEYHGIVLLISSKRLCIASVYSTFGSTIGTHTRSYRVSILEP
ncbi:hypothetical protein HanRHA438_Chr07g0316161 [Helianthus annuus]|nr:hypothetical protein HanRHA438_Chr07g0316161 [Helianthus annuus]